MINQIPNQLLEIINNGEGVTTEFKEANKNLPKSLFETVCAFLNRNGGHIFLGIGDNREILGISEDNIVKLRKDFINLCNNSEKIEPTVYLNVREYEIEKRKYYTFMFMKAQWYIKLMELFLIEMKMEIIK